MTLPLETITTITSELVYNNNQNLPCGCKNPDVEKKPIFLTTKEGGYFRWAYIVDNADNYEQFLLLGSLSWQIKVFGCADPLAWGKTYIATNAQIQIHADKSEIYLTYRPCPELHEPCAEKNHVRPFHDRLNYSISTDGKSINEDCGQVGQPNPFTYMGRDGRKVWLSYVIDDLMRASPTAGTWLNSAFFPMRAK